MDKKNGMNGVSASKAASKQSGPLLPMPEVFNKHFNEASSFSKMLAAILIIAAVVRVWHIISIYHLPFFDNLIIDSKKYDDWAMFIANGNWLGGNNAFYMDPLYPYQLAVQYSIFGHNLLIVRLVQAAFGVATCYLVAVIGRRIGGNSVGLLSALLAALYQPLIFEGGEIEKTATGILLITASLFFATSKTTTSKFTAGAFLALASLCRGNLLAIGPLGTIYFLFNSEKEVLSSANSGIKEWLRTHLLGKPARDAIAFMFGFLLLLSPVLVRNHYVSGEWILTTSQFGANFYTGNNPSNSFGAFSRVPFVNPNPKFEENDFNAKAEELTGKKLSAKEVSSFWFHKALEHIRNEPSFASMVFYRKIISFWNDLEIADGWSMYFVKKYSTALSVAIFTFGWIFPFASIGAVVSFQQGKEARLLIGFVLMYFLSVIIFFNLSRYRIFVVPPLLVLAPLGIKWMWDRMQNRNWNKFFAGCLAVIAAAVFTFHGTGYIMDIAINYSNMANIFINKGDYKSAEALLREANQLWPESAAPLCKLSRVHMAVGDLEGAANDLLRCLEKDASFPNAWNNLGRVYDLLGKYQEAIKCYENQLALTPGNEVTKSNLQSLQRLHSVSGERGAPPVSLSK
jgi:4-amino-4-deoxy-L-arabinose transferase-like glycosyltransferase